MKLQFIRPHRQWAVGDIGEVSHEGVANELIRRGLAHPFQETPVESEGDETESTESEAANEQHHEHGKKRKRKG